MYPLYPINLIPLTYDDCFYRLYGIFSLNFLILGFLNGI